MSDFPPKPDDLRPVGMVCAVEGVATRVRIVDHVFDRHSLGGWGYRISFTDAKNPVSSMLWPHWLGSLLDLHPLEVLAQQAE